MSFKYRFILSFVLLEVVFIVLIVSMNFYAITNSSEKLIKSKIESNMVFLNKLIKVPISVFDLATLDEVVESTYNLSFVNSIIVVDEQDDILSSKYNFEHNTIEEFMKKKANGTLNFDDHSYEARYTQIIEEEIKFGAIYLIYDNSENAQFIEQNKRNTILVILFEILISTILSYIIGSKLASRLETLADTAKLIGENKEVEFEHKDSKDEIGDLSRAMYQMRKDIKERREKLKGITAELASQKKELLIASKAKDDFLANMSHELKTPLNSINLISSVMMKNKQGKLDENQVKNLRIINSSGNDLLFLINDVLDISKIEAGQLDINTFTFDLKTVMNQIVEMFEPLVINKNLNLEYKIDEIIGEIKSDENRLKQIIKNLLSNALKFTKEGNIKLIVKEQNENIRILVQDDGIGIEAEKLETIFDRFKQADASTTRKFGGTGLGLAICKELSVLLGGDIEVKSKVGKGTAFLVTIKKDLVIEKNINIEKSTDELMKEPTQESSEHEMEMELFEEPGKTVDDSPAKVILYNSNPSLFFPIIVALKKFEEITFKQVSSKDDLQKEIEQMEANVFIFDGDNKDDEIASLIQNSNLFTLALADNISYENISKVLAKNINIDEIKNSILKR